MPSHLTGRLWVPAPSLLVWRGLWKPISHRGGWRQSWESLTSWSRPTSALCQCRGPARALWDLPGQLAELRPSPRRLRDRRASWLQPSQGPGLESPLDLSGLYQAMAPGQQAGSVRSGEFMPTLAFPSDPSKRRLLIPSLRPGWKPVSLVLSSTRSPCTPTPDLPLIQGTDTAQHKGLNLYVFHIFFKMHFILSFF